MRLGFALVAIALATTVAAQQLPNGFSDQMVVNGMGQPTSLAFLPDGRMLITEQRTGVVLVAVGGTTSTVGIVPNVNSSGNERGLLGLDVDPAWPGRPYIYVYYNSTSPAAMRLSRFEVTGQLTNGNSNNLSLGGQYDLITDGPDNRSNHNGGTCRFGPDGMLYVSLGDDAANPCDAQNTGDLRGVILRLDVSGLPTGTGGPPAKSALVAAGNPFAGPGDNDRLTWVYGLRNPYRFNIDPVTGFLYIADVGANAFEELSEAKAGGGNFGWPWYEGTARQSNCSGSLPTQIGPIAQYSHSGFGSLSIISFTRYRNLTGGAYNFGNNYEGDAFYLDYYQGFLRRLKETGGNWNAAPNAPGQPNANDWGTGMTFVGDAQLGPDGAIYYVKQFPGEIRRVIYTPQLPTVTAPASVSVNTNLLVRSSRNPGDFVILAIAFAKIPQTALPGFFGRLEIIPTPLISGAANASGNLDLNFTVPAAALGITAHFQCVAITGGENYLSNAASVTVVP